MTPFQTLTMGFIALWLCAVLLRFRRSTVALAGGLVVVGLLCLAGVALRFVSLEHLGLGLHPAWLATVGSAAAWLALMLAYSPLADRIATRWTRKPPTLGAFKALQESRARLVAGIAIAWILGGFLEELAFRGVVLRAVEGLGATWLGQPLAAGLGIAAAAAGAGVIHLYQGPRAVIIITQLSALFGLLFVLSGHNLWTVILCHGLYDTVAFIRFANRSSKYARPEGSP